MGKLALTDSTYGCVDNAAISDVMQAGFDAELIYSLGGGPSLGFRTKGAKISFQEMITG